MLMGASKRTKGNVVARKRRLAAAHRAVNEVVQIGVRLEEGLRRRIERVASQRGQSMNAEIVERLRRSFQSDEDKISLIARAMIDTFPDIVNRIEEIRSEELDVDVDAARKAYEEEIELRAQELLAERDKEKESK